MTAPNDQAGGHAAVAANGPSSVPVQVPLPSSIWAAAADPRAAAFLLLVGLSIAWLWAPLATVMTISLRYGENEQYSHIAMIPLVSIGLVYLRRGAIFARVACAPGPGGALMLTGIGLSWLAQKGPVTDPEQSFVSLALLAFLVLCAGAFLLCFGASAFRAAAFPVSFLLLMVPMPPRVLHEVTVFLQRASAEATDALFDFLGVPVYRDGFFFALPGLVIQVAEQCSGIRSFMALVIASLVAGHLVLRTAWARTALVLTIPSIAIVKNAIRIVVLSLLAIHVDKGFITGGFLHQRGGIPLFIVTLLLVGGLVLLLRRAEGRRGRPDV
jgi:exosortase